MTPPASQPNDGRRRPPWLLPTPARHDEIGPEATVRTLLIRLMRGEDLPQAEAATLFGAAMDERATDAQIGAALVALAVKGETVAELTGMAEAMRARAVRIHSHHERFIDTAGTGSSYAKTFNVSTAAAFACAGAGVPVAKHGSRAATSLSGSADVLTELGVNIQVEAAISENCLNEIGICFLFAPLYHQATARVAHLRRQLGVHTTFNLLGPLTNPAGAPRQLIGVWHESLLEPLAHTLLALGTEHAWVVHGSDGLDEVTTTGLTKVAEAREGQVRIFEVGPADFDLPRCLSLEELRGGTPSENAQLIRAILQNETGPRLEAARDLVLANAAAAIVVGGRETDLRAAAERARDSLRSGAAFQKLEMLCRATNVKSAAAS
ncbi:MAG: anthranilate phosphoribosyltransferase [Chthoniobacterales bacterium]|nr:anthranilate phosphoribosyltransferase [Chthoniobacterales bacterium]